MKILSKILFWASGARVDLLNKVTELEKRKFQLIGASLIISTVLATISSSYAITLISNNTIASILIGLMWGILVLSLNRLFLSLILNKKNNKIKKLVWFLPSLILGFTVSLTISYPIQLKIFHQEIVKQIANERLIELDETNQVYQSKINSKYDELKKYQSQLTAEIKGNGKNGNAGYGPISKQLEQAIHIVRNEISQLQLDKENTAKTLNSKQLTFLEQTITLQKLTNNSDTIKIINYSILLVLLLTELMPIIIVFTATNGIYEELVKRTNKTAFSFNENKSNDIKGQENDDLSKNQFQQYCISSINDINSKIDSLTNKAQEQLRSGLLISLLGILAYLGYGAFLFIVYFETHEFKDQHLFLFSSLSIVFFFIQFLASWYLKQYRNTINSTNNLTNEKERYSKYILAKLTTTELEETDNNKLLETKLLIELLSDKGIDSSEITKEIQQADFEKTITNSINNLKEMINNLNKKK